MAQEPESDRSEAMIARAGKHKWGYDTDQVDAFLAHAHKLYESDVSKLTQRDIGNVSFDLCKNGYIIPQVDAALSRLSRAVSDRLTSWQIGQYGQARWIESAVGIQQELAVHALRAEGERFAPGREGDPSYDRKQVDRLVDQVVAKTASQLGLESVDPEDERNLADITADRVSNVIFTQRRGKHGYDERQVDYYLVRAVELLQKLESYIRLGAGATAAKPASMPGSGEGKSPSDGGIDPGADLFADAEATAAMTPLKDAGAADTVIGMQPVAGAGFEDDEVVADDTGGSSVPAMAQDDTGQGAAAGGDEDRFDRLHEAEQAIFEGADGDAGVEPAAAPPAPASVPVFRQPRRSGVMQGRAGELPARVTQPVQDPVQADVPAAPPVPAATGTRRPGRRTQPGQPGTGRVQTPAAPPAPDVAKESNSSLAALARSAATSRSGGASQPAPASAGQQVASGVSAPASTRTATARRQDPPVPSSETDSVERPAPLEETASFNPLTDWEDETGATDTSGIGGNPPEAVAAPQAPVPAARRARHDANPEEELFDVHLPEVDADIPSLSFPSFDDTQEPGDN
ncbi:hypothetical protein [Bifidobacterium xylocopae]|nr:hypothetical protein [Bifidobacterium xylocopae]